MATDGDRNRRLGKESRRQRRRMLRIVADTDREVGRLLDAALAQITARLAGAPTEFEAFLLPQIQQSIRRTLAAAGEGMAGAARDGATQAFDAGVDMVDRPIAVGGVRLAAALPEVDRRQLMAMRTFLTGRMKDVAAAAADRINSELGLAMIGAQTPSQATSKIAGILATGGRERALRITRTEMGRAFSAASHERLQQAGEILPGLRKQWRRSGKRHSRATHDLADGQTRKVDEPFDVGGEELMFPRDPKGSPANTINCGCTVLPAMADWEVRHPGGQPFADSELAASAGKRGVAAARADAFSSWVGRLAAGRLKAAGSFEAIGALGVAETAFLAARGIAPATAEIAVSDRRVTHMLREAKRRRRQALPAGQVRRLPELVGRPKAVLWQLTTKAPTLVYVFAVPGDKRLGVLPVRIQARDPRAGRRSHNWVTTGGLVSRATLTDAKTYTLIAGEL